MLACYFIQKIFNTLVQYQRHLIDLSCAQSFIPKKLENNFRLSSSYACTNKDAGSDHTRGSRIESNICQPAI